ncbi:hypothetical protein EAJ18_22365 [Citrobacter amalonaticus]|uniref:Uncharacterized protein n=1 Tax=Citrobacter amalonaticus TaxID=35703 RepID=A0ABY0HN57_CITAM|nr:hypothetical protein EAJ18_22365 [Citrobacter amalonaticus]
MQAFGNAAGKTIVPDVDELESDDAWIISALCSPKNNTGIFATREFDVISSVAASIFAASPKPTFPVNNN